VNIIVRIYVYCTSVTQVPSLCELTRKYSAGHSSVGAEVAEIHESMT
jgi:hypothetical protein